MKDEKDIVKNYWKIFIADTESTAVDREEGLGWFLLL